MLSTTTFSSLSFGEWELVASSDVEGRFYWDRDKVRVSQGLIYSYLLQNYIKPNEVGNLSATVYIESDCQRMSVLRLSFSSYKQAMAEGQADNTYTLNDQKVYPLPTSFFGVFLNKVCDYVNNN